MKMDFDNHKIGKNSTLIYYDGYNSIDSKIFIRNISMEAI